jgi:hypothetical protein
VTAALELLQRRGAGAIEHPGGTLLAHLVRVSERLRAYGASEDLQLAGLMHAAYSTDGFDTALLTRDERPLLVDVIGEAAETIVYRYAATDRLPFYRQLGQPLVVWTDRFTRSGITFDPTDVAPLVELTVANELDVLEHLEVPPNEALRDLFARARPAMSTRAWADVTRTLEPS